MSAVVDRLVDGVARRFAHGEVIARQGEETSRLLLVTGGAVRLSSVSSPGREVVVGLLGPGDVFGEAALLGHPSPVDARALGTATVIALPVASIRQLVERHPAVAEELLRMVAARLHRTSIALEEALGGDLPARVAGRLRALAAGHGVVGPAGVRLRVPLTQEELGRMVGASREAVNRTVGSFAARGLVRSNGRHLVIPDPEALAEPDLDERAGAARD
ncbi:MAG TPA: Crp/Fnr family transcriptional regulator [Actinomycetota bacterium]